MKKVYVDMDGVITDFKSAVLDLDASLNTALEENAPPDAKDRMFKAIEDAGPNFWANMSWTKDGKELLENIKNPVLLSSPGRDGKFRTYAEEGKKIWVQNNCPGTPLFLEPDKFFYADRDSVLIDDMKENVDAWTYRGGVGILHKDTPSTLALLRTATKSTTAALIRSAATSLLRRTAVGQKNVHTYHLI